MKFTVAFIAFLSISSAWAIEVKNADEPKEKREAPVGYSSSGLSSHSFQAPSIGHEGASAISVGAGYSVGAKPYSFAGHGSSAPLQLSSEGLQSSGHATIKLPAITLQPNQGFASSDLSQLMSQLSHSINSGGLNLQPSSGLESYAAASQGEHGGQELALAQYSFAAPQFQQYSVSEQPGVPSYAVGTKGLGSYGATGPVLFTPSEGQAHGAALNYAPSAGHSFGDASNAGISLGGVPSSGHSFGGANFGHSLGEGAISLGGSGHSLGGISLGGHAQGGPSLGGHSLGGYSLGGHSLGGHSLGGHSLGGQSLGGHSLGGQSLGGHSLDGHSLGGHSLGGSGGSVYGGSFKNFGGSYTVPGKTSFKPSAFLGASVQSDSGHGLSSLSGSHGAPSFSGLSSGHGALSLGSGGHGASFGGSFGGSSTKFLAPSYAPTKSEGFGSLESVASFASSGRQPSSHSSYSGPSSYHATAAHAASSSSPQYYAPSTKYSSSGFGKGSSSYRASASSHSPLSSSSGPKHGFGSRSSTRYAAPEDAHGSYSENTYNTIKYSEELKPRAQ